MSSSDKEEALAMCLLILEGECGAQEFRTSLQTLRKILQNVKSNPTDEKYKSIKKENKAFNQRVWRLEGAQQFMLASGWVEVDDTVVLTEDTELDVAIGAVEAQLSSLPVDVTPTPAAPPPQINTLWSEKEQEEKEKKIAEERKSRLDRLKRDKEEKKRISEQIKADRQEASTRENKDSHATVLNYGSNVKKFHNAEDSNPGGG